MYRNQIEAQEFEGSFNLTERGVIAKLVGELAKRNFSPIMTQWGVAVRPSQLTNEQVSQTKAVLEQNPLGPGTQLDLWVMYCAALEAEIPCYSKDKLSALEQAALPLVRQIHGKLLQARGFQNRAVAELIASR